MLYIIYIYILDGSNRRISCERGLTNESIAIDIAIEGRRKYDAYNKSLRKVRNKEINVKYQR